MSLEINFREKKIFSTSMFRWGFLKKFSNVFFGDEMELLCLYLTATINKEFTGKLLCRKQSSEKKIRLEHHISRTGKCCESEDRS